MYLIGLRLLIPRISETEPVLSVREYTSYTYRLFLGQRIAPQGSWAAGPSELGGAYESKVAVTVALRQTG